MFPYCNVGSVRWKMRASAKGHLVAFLTNLPSCVFLSLRRQDLQRTSADSHGNEYLLELYCTSLQCLVPKLYVSIMETAPFKDAALASEHVDELDRK